jgi:phenylpyruvate tautomerase PptA (4-oxalocrotonate tautomerase family)
LPHHPACLTCFRPFAKKIFPVKLETGGVLILIFLHNIEPKVIFMPLLKLETTVTLADDKKQALLASLSKIVAGTIGKPEQYVMVVISAAAILMSGKPGDAAFVDIRSIGGLGGDVNQQLAQKIGGLLKESLGVPPDRIYLNFTDVAAANWGWNGDTFG